MSLFKEELTENTYLAIHEVGSQEQGMRLDAYLKQVLNKRSREQIKKAIETGKITLERKQNLELGKLKPSISLLAGDKVQVLSERGYEPSVDFNYQILFEDNHLFVIDKPPNLPVHPAGKYFFNTLTTHLKTQGHKTPLLINRDYFLVHRIDKETSGVLVLAKDKVTCAHLTNQFFERTTSKKYLAIVHGITQNTFVVDEPMKKDEFSELKVKMRVAADGLSALTEFRRLDVFKNFSLLECFPKTGRQHQIRVHLAHTGHPIVGDKIYGVVGKETLLPRHALHAASLHLVHPATGKKLEFSSPLPEDLKKFLSSPLLS